MTTLGLPWWAWIPVALSAGLAHMAVACLGQLARRRHLLTCRVYWQLRAVVHAGSCFASNVCVWALWSPSPVRYLLVIDAWNEGRRLWMWLVRRRTVPASEPVQMPDPDTGEWFPVAYHHWLAGTWQQAWRHREHDDDCEHGPTKRWAGSAARLLSWRKVAVNPDFAPA